MSDLLANITARRNERVQDKHLDLFVPTWDRDMVIRFDVLARSKVEKFANKKRAVESDMDFIIQATREIYLLDEERQADSGERMQENQDYVRLEDEVGTPVKWDVTLAEKLQKSDLTKSREILLYVFDNNTLAVGGIASKLITWMQNTDAEIGEALVGES